MLRSWAPPIAAPPSIYERVEHGKEVQRDISGRVIANAAKLGIDAIITIGGDGSQKIGFELSKRV